MSNTPLEPHLPSLILDDEVPAGRPRSQASHPTGPNAWWIAAIGVVIAAAVAIYWLWQRQPAPVSSPAPAIAQAPPTATAQPEPAIRHPIDEARAGLPAPTDRAPTLGESDALLRAALAVMSGATGFERLFHPDEIVRRFVATVDNLPRKAVAAQVMAARPVPGLLLATSTDGRLAISSENAGRYTPYVRLADSVDAKALVALYVRFYPLFQGAYQDLGYPSGYFNDRLIDVIDNLLATPQLSGSATLVQPHVLYEFENADLESLSAGQKIMLRMGGDNASRVKAKLREVRRLLTGAKAELTATPPN
jgi:hypothetical protein